MKRFLKSFFSLVLVLTMVFAVAQPVHAAYGWKVKTLKSGKTAKGSSGYDALYKITVKSPGYLTITDNLFNRCDYHGSFLIFDAQPDPNGDIYERQCIGLLWNKEKMTFPLDKGTYYIAADSSYDGSEMVGYNFKFNFKKAKITSGNYCRKKATALKKNKNVTINQPSGYGAPAWYKIKVSGSQYITITYDDGKDFDPEYETVYGRFELVDAKGHTVASFSQLGDTSYQSDSPVGKGTYYIHVVSNSSTFLATLKWK